MKVSIWKFNIENCDTSEVFKKKNSLHGIEAENASMQNSDTFSVKFSVLKNFTNAV